MRESHTKCVSVDGATVVGRDPVLFNPWTHGFLTSLYYKRVDPYVCSELAPVLEGYRSRRRYPRKGTSVDSVYVVFVARVDRRIFFYYSSKTDSCGRSLKVTAPC